MDMDVAQYLLTEPKRDKENKGVASPAKEAYRKLLADTMLQGRTRILSFRNKPPAPVNLLPIIPSSAQAQPAKQRRHIPQVYSLVPCSLFGFSFLNVLLFVFFPRATN